MAQADTLLPSDPALRQQILKYTTPARYAMPVWKLFTLGFIKLQKQ